MKADSIRIRFAEYGNRSLISCRCHRSIRIRPSHRAIGKPMKLNLRSNIGFRFAGEEP